MSQESIVLPGAIPGLLRRGSPVVVTALDALASADRMKAGDSGVVSSPPAGAEGWTMVSGETVDDLGPSWCEVKASALSLDLTDATGRAHAAAWLAEHFSYDASGGVTWGRSWDDLPHWIMAGAAYGIGHRWSLTFLPDAGLDLTPDLSDAEALRRVVLHVAGVTP